MKLGVVGYGHFAQVAAFCLASKGHRIFQYDELPHLVREGQPPETSMKVFDAGTIRRIYMTHDPDRLRDCDLVWVCYDTPLDANGRGDVSEILERIKRMAFSLRKETTVMISSQWPVGTTMILESECSHLTFAYSPENVRVGKAIDDFLHPGRVVVGTRSGEPLPVITEAFQGITDHLLWMVTESAEMSKHALNAFLALQIAFINEIDRLCQADGAKAMQVAEALLTDSRISPNAYLKPGKPFGGGSLQRDLVTLNELAAARHINVPILNAIIPSNDSQ